MYKEDLALNNPQWLICHKTKQNQSKPVGWQLQPHIELFSVKTAAQSLMWYGYRESPAVCLYSTIGIMHYKEWLWH